MAPRCGSSERLLPHRSSVLFRHKWRRGHPPRALPRATLTRLPRPSSQRHSSFTRRGNSKKRWGSFRTGSNDGSPNARLNVALCLEQLGKNVEAYKEMLHTMKEAGARNDGKYQQTRDAAEAELAVLNVRVAKLVVTLADSPPGLAITVDGVPVEASDIGGSLLLEPGAHKIEAAADHQSLRFATCTSTWVRPAPWHWPSRRRPRSPRSRKRPGLPPPHHAMGGGYGVLLPWPAGGWLSSPSPGSWHGESTTPCASTAGGALVPQRPRRHRFRQVAPDRGQRGADRGGAVGVAARRALLLGSRNGGRPRATAAPLPGGGYVTYADKLLVHSVTASSGHWATGGGRRGARRGSADFCPRHASRTPC